MLNCSKLQVNKIKVGGPMEEGTKLGPLISKAQQEKVLGFVERAKAQGAKVRTRTWISDTHPSTMSTCLLCMH